MTNTNKSSAKPISVSHCNPVYVNGKIKYWNVYVEYAGNISMNSDTIAKWREIISKNPKVLENNPFYHDVLRPIFNPNIIIPNIEHATEKFKYDSERDVSLMGYSWRDGLFGRGAERAWNFRLKMLADIMNNRQK